ncbi:DUF2283 domain-containing protein [candidate division KSB1 bacterium]|nr:DUF2283 domain-containing protein [candidate division KSB1 bacterium]
MLYISFSPSEKATSAVELNDNILLRFNFSEKRAVGLTLMDFSIIVQLTELGPRSFTLNGLKDIEPEWQDIVIDIITKSPINEILKVSVYTPYLNENIPIAYIDNLPAALAALYQLCFE